MKKCPYCGHLNDDTAWRCEKCIAGFPHEETKDETPDEPVRVTKKKKTRSE